MAYFAEQSESIRNIEVIVNGRNESIIHFCSRSVKSLITDVEKLTSTLKDYYGKKSQRSHATKRILRRITGSLKEMFKGASSSLTFVLDRNHIKDLIQAAKNVESSLHYALSTVLLARNEFK